MPTKQGDLALLNDPVAQRLLQSTTPAPFAYKWSDSTPRVVPMGFDWNGAEIVLGPPPDAPKRLCHIASINPNKGGVVAH